MNITTTKGYENDRICKAKLGVYETKGNKNDREKGKENNQTEKQTE